MDDVEVASAMLLAKAARLEMVVLITNGCGVMKDYDQNPVWLSSGLGYIL
jgi:hypothetical protein